jgi:hypothetical protein
MIPTERTRTTKANGFKLEELKVGGGPFNIPVPRKDVQILHSKGKGMVKNKLLSEVSLDV